ncbi:MAG: hypothetical protein ACJ71Q_10420 [Terriglobales bacterium]
MKYPPQSRKCRDGNAICVGALLSYPGVLLSTTSIPSLGGYQDAGHVDSREFDEQCDCGALVDPSF